MKEKTIGQIVTSDMRTATVFKKYGIDFCCGGGNLISEACNVVNVDENVILDEIALLDKKEAMVDFDKMGLIQLISYIKDNHHYYVKNTMPIISQFANKVAKVHGNSRAETIEIASLFNELSNELERHMVKEEQILFPNIIELESRSKDKKVMSFPFGSISNPINMMESEHDYAGYIYEKIEILSDDFTPPDHACNTYRALYHHLKEFRDDLHIHIHLENNILFPKAIELENRINS